MIPYIIALIVFAIIAPFLPRIRGWFGEKNVALVLGGLPSDSYTVCNNTMLPTEHGTSQIDHIVVSPFGIFVIETKNYNGWIYGSEYAEQWTQNLYGKKYRFHSPIRQNFGHIKALEAATGLPDTVFFPIVAFSPRARLFVKSTKPVIYYHQLRREIKKHQEVVISNEQIPLLVEQIRNLNLDSKENRKNHVAAIQSTISDRDAKIQNRICPKCGAPLVERRGSYGSFLGCKSYPKCKFTAKL